jgi:hypothetical protein
MKKWKKNAHVLKLFARNIQMQAFKLALERLRPDFHRSAISKKISLISQSTLQNTLQDRFRNAQPWNDTFAGSQRGISRLCF